QWLARIGGEKNELVEIQLEKAENDETESSGVVAPDDCKSDVNPLINSAKSSTAGCADLAVGTLSSGLQARKTAPPSSVRGSILSISASAISGEASSLPANSNQASSNQAAKPQARQTQDVASLHHRTMRVTGEMASMIRSLQSHFPQ